MYPRFILFHHFLLLLPLLFVLVLQNHFLHYLCFVLIHQRCHYISVNHVYFIITDRLPALVPMIQTPSKTYIDVDIVHHLKTGRLDPYRIDPN
jgi:hypothetical protein